MAKQRPDAPSAQSGWVCLGVVTRPKGVRGDVRITCFTDQAGDLVSYGPLHQGPGGAVVAVKLREVLAGGVVVAALAGVSDRDQAEAMRGVELYVPRDALPAPEEDEFYHGDLIGLAVETPDGAAVGTVRAIHDFGAGEILEVHSNRGDDLMLPFTNAAVPVIDIAGGRLVIDPPAETDHEKEGS